LQTIKIYLDLPFFSSLLGWILDGSLLWMVSQISSYTVKMRRLILGGAVGGAFQFILLLNQASNGFLDNWILSPFIFLIGIPLMMIGITFLPTRLPKILRVAGYFYGLSFLLSGIQWGLDTLNERFFHLGISFIWRFCFQLCLIFVLGELGWGVVHRKFWEQLCFYPIQIEFEGCQLQLNALLDTGNRLHDPLTKLPVVIIELSQIKSHLPKEVVGLTESFNEGGMAADYDWNLSDDWAQRVRVLPYNSLGNIQGVLLGFRPDRMKVWCKEKETVIPEVIVAFYNRPLSQEGTFQALIPPTVLTN
jgi:stage II sporulation protein GA (sporulation sigma-E factor processing peptidase)